MSNAQVSVQSERAAAAGGGVLFSEALQRALLEEVVRAVSARVLEDVGRLLEGVERQTSALRQNVRAVEEKLAALERRTQGFGDSLKQGKKALKELGQRVVQAEREAKKVDTVELSGRMESLEESLHKALTTVMPKVEALVAQLEAPPAASSGTTSSALPPSPARAPSPATRERLGGELREAAEEGRAERVRELLDAGADVDARDDWEGTPLHRAAREGQEGVVALLLGRGADARAKDDFGRTALHLAASCDSSGLCVSLLLAAGENVNCVNIYGATPLDFAASWGNETAVQVLLAAGADKAARDDEGATPLDDAASDAILRLLRD